jgi:hypothetical protein
MPAAADLPPAISAIERFLGVGAAGATSGCGPIMTIFRCDDRRTSGGGRSFDDSRRARDFLIIVLASFCVVGIGGVSVLALIWDLEPNTLPFEAGKVLLQLVLVSVAGTTLSVVSSDYQRRRGEQEKERDEAQRRREFRREQITAVLARTTASYNKVKRARRMLRIRRQAGSIHLAEDYDTQLEEIQDAQLEFETLKTVVTAGATVVFSNSAELKNQLRNIEQYLGGLIGEQEKKRSLFTGDPAQLDEAQLSELRGFVAPRKDGIGFDKAITAYHAAIKLMLHDLAELAAADSAPSLATQDSGA